MTSLSLRDAYRSVSKNPLIPPKHEKPERGYYTDLSVNPFSYSNQATSNTLHTDFAARRPPQGLQCSAPSTGTSAMHSLCYHVQSKPKQRHFTLKLKGPDVTMDVCHYRTAAATFKESGKKQGLPEFGWTSQVC
eukprot:4015398-Amphidinium_carterae.2